MIIHIVAFDLNGGIGLNNQLPWSYSEDLNHFKEFTDNQSIYIGYNTYLSLLKYAQNREYLLPNRKVNVVLNRELSNFTPIKKGVEFITKDELDLLCKSNKTILIAGGSKLYSLYTPDIIIGTELQDHIKCDSYYPIDLSLYSKFRIKKLNSILHVNIYTLEG